MTCHCHEKDNQAPAMGAGVLGVLQHPRDKIRGASPGIFDEPLRRF